MLVRKRPGSVRLWNRPAVLPPKQQNRLSSCPCNSSLTPFYFQASVTSLQNQRPCIRGHIGAHMRHTKVHFQSSDEWKFTSKWAFKGSSSVRLYGNYEVPQSSVDLHLEENKQTSFSQDQDKDECFLLSLPQKYLQKLCCTWVVSETYQSFFKKHTEFCNWPHNWKFEWDVWHFGAFLSFSSSPL